MAYKIIWQQRAVNTYLQNVQYLKKNWSEKEIENFETACNNKLTNISNHPHLGSSRNKKNTNIRFTLINKRVALVLVQAEEKRSSTTIFLEHLSKS